MSGDSRIAVTGVGAVTPYGEGPGVLWEGLIGSASAVKTIDRFDTSRLRSHLAALVPRIVPQNGSGSAHTALRRADAASRLAVPASAQALEQARVVSRHRTGVILGTNSAGSIPVAEFLRTLATSGPSAAPPILFPYTVANAPASQCAMVHGLKGPNLTIVQKEGSSTGAISTACRMLASGAADSLLAGGSEDLSVHVYEVYDRLGVLSRDQRDAGGGPEGSRPFDRSRNGLVLGEGACFLLLETLQSVQARGREPLAFIEGTGEARSPVAPHEFPRDAAPLARAIERALEAAGIGPASIHAIFGSADSTCRLDAAEADALRRVFGSGVPPTCSVRGAIGESGVAGAVSALAACFSIREGILPGTAGLERLDEALGIDAASTARRLKITRALVTGFSSGGAANAIVFAA